MTLLDKPFILTIYDSGFKRFNITKNFTLTSYISTLLKKCPETALCRKKASCAKHSDWKRHTLVLDRMAQDREALQQVIKIIQTITDLYLPSLKRFGH